MAFNPLVITNAGNAMSAQAWASSGVLTITSVVAGSGFPGATDYVPGYTGLKNPVMNLQVTGINNLVSGQLTVRANLSSANAPTTFNVNEIGAFGSINGGTPQLVAYMTTGANNGDTITPTGTGTPVVKDYGILQIFQQAISTSGVIQLLQVVGLHAGSHISTGIDPIPVSTTTATGLLIPLSGNAYDSLGGDGAWHSGWQAGMSMEWNGPSAPAGSWLPENGASYATASYPKLFAAIGLYLGRKRS